MNLPVYRMSESGTCRKALVAKSFAYEPTPQTETDISRLNHYTRCEVLAAQQIMDEGYRVEPSSPCQKCKEEFGEERNGIHVEVETTFFRMVGHLDRRIVLDNGVRLPVEIKSLGPSSFTKFKKTGFASFRGYECQEACYLEAEGKPGIYWVMNRDNGENLKYIVNDFKNEYYMPGFEKVELSVRFGDIIDEINNVELDKADNRLPDMQINDQCRFCRYVYLCEKESTSVDIVETPQMIQAADMYRSGMEMVKLGQAQKSEAEEILLNYSKTHDVAKFRVPDKVSFTFSGMKQRENWDADLIKKSVDESTWKKWRKLSKPYPSVIIRQLKGNND